MKASKICVLALGCAATVGMAAAQTQGTSQGSGQSTGQGGSQTSGQGSGQSTGQGGSQTSGQGSGQSTGQGGSQTSGQGSGQSTGQGGSQTSGQGMGQSMGQGSDQDKQFIMTASQSDYNEMTFSNLALQKSQNPRVKAYAQKMIQDHTKLENQMKPVASQMGVAPVTSLDAMHQQKYDQLSALSGTDFDKQYMSDMDTDHHASLDSFKAEESSTQNAQLKPIVKKGEKVVAQHTQMADKMMQSMGGSSSGA